jgi:hypothetical protein
MEKMSKATLLKEFASLLTRTPLDQMRVRFNPDSDEVFINLSRGRIRAVSIPVARNISVRVSPDRNQVLGMQLENFTTSVVFEHPQMVGLLDVAETYDYSDEAIMSLRRRVARDPLRGLTPALLADEVNELMVAVGD